MRELRFKQGLIWRLATTYGPMQKYHTESDICTYTRSVLIGLFFVLGIIISASILLYPFADGVAYLVALAQGYRVSPSELLMAGMIVYGALGTLLGFMIYQGYRSDKKRELRHRMDNDPTFVPPRDSFFSEAWKAFKNKTCVRVKFQ